MNKCILLLMIVALKAASLQAQGSDSDLKANDPGFISAYSRLAFQPGTDHQLIIRKWNDTIRIFIEGTHTEHLSASLHNDMAELLPLLNGTVILFTADRGEANYLVKADTLVRTHYELNWDVRGNIYKAQNFINTKQEFNRKEQEDRLRHFLLICLGDFHLPVSAPAIASRFNRTVTTTTSIENIATASATPSSIYSFRSPITDFDRKVIRLHYSNAVKAGMTESELMNSLASLPGK